MNANELSYTRAATMRWTLMVAVIALGLNYQVSAQQPMNPPDLPVIEVHLLGKTAQVQGKTWPTRHDGQPSALTAIEEPCELLLHLPSGKALRLHAQTVTLSQQDDRVSAVTVLPLETLVDYPQVVTETERLVSQLGIANAALDAKLAQWREQRPVIDTSSASWPKYMTKVELEPNVYFYPQIKAHVSGRGWFIAFEFSKPARN